ncbi:SsgA family sporulation/cell division regulator [Streptomyces sp. NPDC001985]|uniref:SsgA family sporulation/cell division regulator n=1 Tax=Streptomyces sp. NPDC001985 TaxID=3154406 RepID=UPI003330D384
MSAAVEDLAWGRIVSDAPQPERPVRVTLSYEPADDPRAVRFSFPSGFTFPGESGGTVLPHDWTFPREVLETGLRAPAHSGNVEVWPCGRVQAVVEFHTADGVSVVQFDTSALNRFLRHTYAAAGAEAPTA